jgi:methylthioribulose-1-phosphate dehydratase
VTYSETDLQLAKNSIREVANFLNSKGWTPATSSNFSQRLDSDHCAITVSGKHKGKLTSDDIMVVDLKGNPVTPQKPSAETLLHTSLYKWDESIGAVLHTHSLNSTLLSLLENESILRLQGYELQKAFSGISTHENIISIPIFENTQDILVLAEEVITYLNTGVNCWVYLIRGHGIYSWGRDMDEALRHLEAAEYLLQCELELMRIKGGK